MNQQYVSVATGIGACLPARIMTNDELAQIVDTSDDWIRERTGIRQRHVAAEGEKTSDLALAAAREALADAGITADDIDLIVMATTTPDRTFPASAVRVQAGLGMRHGAAFDVQAVCSGFLYALSTADSFLVTGKAKRALVIGAETMTRLLDWTDRGTCVLFGDGAGAIVLERQSAEQAGGRGVLASRLFADGAQHDLLHVDGGPSETGTVGKLRMQGNAVFRHAVENMSGAMLETARDAGVDLAAVDWVIPHQANQRILDMVARKLSLDPAKVVSTVALHGNTSAASIPLALHTAVKDGRVKRGDLLLLEAMGGGFTWGALMLRW